MSLTLVEQRLADLVAFMQGKRADVTAFEYHLDELDWIIVVSDDEGISDLISLVEVNGYMRAIGAIPDNEEIYWDASWPGKWSTRLHRITSKADDRESKFISGIETVQRA